MFDSDAYASHEPPLQQPPGHDVASQTHWPLLLSHSCPEPHALQVAPPAPHAELDSPESDVHVPELQQPAHAAPPQEHVPPEHESPLPHALHASPPVPHCVCDCVA